MATISSNAVIPIGAGIVVTEEADVLVLPVAAPGAGTGRLVHPSLGTYDYEYPPDEWDGMYNDVIVPPVWSNTRTLAGSINTLWAGNIKDGVVTEKWESGFGRRTEMMTAILAMYLTPPDPAVEHVLWYPSYHNAYGYKVILTDLTVGGKDITVDSLIAQNWLRGAVTLTLRIVERL